jgi:hypothetical protein
VDTETGAALSTGRAEKVGGAAAPVDTIIGTTVPVDAAAGISAEANAARAARIMTPDQKYHTDRFMGEKFMIVSGPRKDSIVPTGVAAITVWSPLRNGRDFPPPLKKGDGGGF